MNAEIGRFFIQAGIGVPDQVQFSWPAGKPLDPDACPRCHDPVVEIGGRYWSVLGIERASASASASASEHVCQGRMGKRSRARRIVAKHPTLFGEKPEDRT